MGLSESCWAWCCRVGARSSKSDLTTGQGGRPGDGRPGGSMASAEHEHWRHEHRDGAGLVLGTSPYRRHGGRGGSPVKPPFHRCITADRGRLLLARARPPGQRGRHALAHREDAEEAPDLRFAARHVRRLGRRQVRCASRIYAPNAPFESGGDRFTFINRLAQQVTSVAGVQATGKAFARAADLEAAIKNKQVDFAVIDGVYLAERGVPYPVLATATVGRRDRAASGRCSRSSATQRRASCRARS